MIKNGIKLLLSRTQPFIHVRRFSAQHSNILGTQPKGSFCVQGKENLSPDDTFGTLDRSTVWDEPDSEEEEELIGEYTNLFDSIVKIKNFLNVHEYDNAKNELRNIQKLRKAPAYIYKLLISYNGKQGNVLEAFKLYNDFKKRGYYVPGAVYTSLFIACARCQRGDVALPIADKITDYLFKSKDHEPNVKNLNAMLMAYGRHGDIKTVLELLEKFGKKMTLGITSYTYALEACISDQNSGLRFALLIWHYMLKKNIKPKEYTFKVIARCIRDCSLGDLKLSQNFIAEIFSEKDTNKTSIDSSLLGNLKENTETAECNKMLVSDHFRQRELQSYSNLDVECEVNMSEGLEVTVIDSISKDQKLNKVDLSKDNVILDDDDRVKDGIAELNLPNLLHPKPRKGSLVTFNDLSTSENRLLLCGGFQGFMEVMNHFNVKPDINLFTILLYCIPSTKEADEVLLAEMAKHNIAVDTVFMNMLLRRRILRCEGYTFEDCLDLMRSYELKPDLITIGVLARSCYTHEDGKKCMELAKAHNIRLNSVILTQLFKHASKINDLNYITDVLNAVKQDSVTLSPYFFQRIQNFVVTTKALKNTRASLDSCSLND